MDIEGGKAGQYVTACEVGGCYAPGGRYPLPSSVLMTAITARVAGVKKVWVASPRPAVVTLAAGYVADADALLAVGGAQAIAALAYGTGEVPAADVIVGPGNKWVTAAKSLISGRCGIDMLAGPSECLVLADETADADVVAADLLAQAEHDTEATPILVTTDATLPARVNAAIAVQLVEVSKVPGKQSNVDIATIATNKGLAVVCPTLERAIAVSDMFAPEHLEIQTADADAVSKRCNHFGGLFVGQKAAEALGDYGAGPNHVLPTGGTARYTGGLSVFSFLRIRTWMRIDDGAGAKLQVCR
jgi:phosphoribosyl-ATP pyrophosphohydrolase/phosphoribosyl-AMP cyclohydrolase/histidinol dehydrogenase